MPNKNWDRLKPLQPGRYTEYYAKMELASWKYTADAFFSKVLD